MMTYFHLAFFMGLFGSVHCAAMCGPLLLAVQQGKKLSWHLIANKLLYQSGRLLTYGLLGLTLGFFGGIALIQGWQQAISLITGIFLIAIAISYMVGQGSAALASMQTKAVQPFVRLMGKWLFLPGGSFIAGVLNGILPCGMVYMALASAMNAESLPSSFLFMLLFGLGTLPLMLIFSFVGHLPKRFLKVSFAKVMPILYLALGLWFILRGANLDIPYLSPLLDVTGASTCG